MTGVNLVRGFESLPLRGSRRGSPRAGLPASHLRALAGLAVAQKAPVLVAPRDQRPQLVALRDGSPPAQPLPR